MTRIVEGRAASAVGGLPDVIIHRRTGYDLKRLGKLPRLAVGDARRRRPAGMRLPRGAAAQPQTASLSAGAGDVHRQRR